MAVHARSFKFLQISRLVRNVITSTAWTAADRDWSVDWKWQAAEDTIILFTLTGK